MALSDYYLCDICGEKVIYDADMFERWDCAGDISIICKECAKTHKIVIVPDEQKEADDDKRDSNARS